MPVPGPDVFSLEDYISEVSTFPKFSHTLFLDQATGVALQGLIEDYDKLAKRGRDIQAKQALMNEHPGTIGLVDDEFDALREELDEVLAKTDALEEELKVAEAKALRASLTLTFQVSTPHHQGKVVRQAEKEFDKEHGRKNAEDLEYATARGRYLMAAQLAAFCVKAEGRDGRVLPVPEQAGFERLMDSLISSESVRLITALNAGLDSSMAWAERLNAGFPGRGADVADQPVGDSGAEGGEELGYAADHDAHGEEELVEG
jgi:hypothetical protein